jgi:hypothetical protein
MKQLRSIHLYLGCIFAPMLLFFAISGIWQTLGLAGSGLLKTLSTIHMMHRLKSDHGDLFLSSPIMMGFVLVMALSFIITTILGIVMAVKFGRSRKAAYCCLAFGVLFPLILVLIRAFT